MKKKVVVGILVSVLTLVVAVVIAVLAFVLHNEQVDEPIATTEMYVPESESTEVQYNVPEVKPTGEHNSTNSGTQVYSDTTVCATFDEDIRNLCVSAFGEYIIALQDSCKFLFDAGYEYFVAYGTDTDTSVVESNYIEFTAYLPGSRARFNIRNDNGKYTTKAWLLAEDELLSPSLVAPDGPDSLPSEEVTGLLPANLDGWSESNEPALYDDYGVLDMRMQPAQFYTFDSDFITELVARDVVTLARDTFNTDAALYDMVSFILYDSGEEALMNITVEKESDTSIKCYWENYMFHIWSNEGKVYSDTYDKR